MGDKIKIKGVIKKIDNNTIFNLFNYNKFCLSKAIIGSIDSDNIILIEKNKNVFYKFKTIILSRVYKIKRVEYLKTFILGDASEINDEVLTSYRENGISHLFSISGMHTALLSYVILLILNKIKRSKLNYIILILFLLLFCFLTNFTPSVLRSTLLFILFIINKLLNLNLSRLRLYIFVLIIVLNLNPYIIYNVGFQFSYIITFFLIRFNKLISNKKTYIVKLLITSSISYIASLPILINNYYSINIISVFNNIIFVPLVSFIVFPLSFLVIILPKLEFIFEFVIYILENLSLLINKFKIEIILCKTSILMFFLYYLIIYYVLIKLIRKRYIYIIFFIIVLLIHSNINLFLNNSFVTYLDVKQGDSVLIHYSYNKGNILIDTGGIINHNVSDNTINYLKSNGIKNISYLILTHGDYDHMGEAINLVENFKVEKVIFNCGPFNDLEKELIKVLDKKKIKYYSCIKELNINSNKLYFLQTKEYDNENDNSNVIYTELNGYKFMFMGDAGVEKEKDILEKYNLSNIDVLKVGHHGSRTSSSKKFIDEINPKYSVISVGKNNRYGHPNKEVLSNLYNSKTYRTYQDGSIMFKIKNNKLQVETCSP